MHIAYQMDITIPGNGMFSENLLDFLQQGNLLGIVVSLVSYTYISIWVPINTLDLEQLNVSGLSHGNHVTCGLKHPKDNIVMRKSVFVCAQNIF